jgi:hypothetical protein
MDDHIDHGFLRLLLAPGFPTHVRCLRNAAGRRIARAARGAVKHLGVSAVMHDLRMWGLGRGTEFRTAGRFFLMGTGVALRYAF